MSRPDGSGPGHSQFHQPWWLETLAPGAWGAVTVEEQGQVVARLPYRIRRRAGLTVLDQPPLTPALGPALASSSGKEASRLSTEMRLLGALVERLPPFDLFVQTFSPAITNWLPFHWAGFEASAGCTYRIDDLADLDSVWSGFSSSVRNDIRNAERALAVRTDLPHSVIADLYGKTLDRRGVRSLNAADLLRLLAECDGRGVGEPLFAVDGQDRVHAACYIVWDQQAAYYLIGARDEQFANRGAMSLLIWEAIRRASAVTKAFDFEGSMIEPVERYFRSFGGRQVLYLRVTKVSRRARALLSARAVARFLGHRAG